MLRRERLMGSHAAKSAGDVKLPKRLPRVLLPLLLLGGSLSAVFAAALPASATATLTHPAGFPVAANGDVFTTPNGSAAVSMPSNYATVGDLAVLTGHYTSTTVVLNSITATQSGPWTLQFRHVDLVRGDTTDIWTAPVTNTSAHDALTLSFSGSLTGVTTDFWPDSLTAGLGASTVWSFGASGSTHDVSGTQTVLTYPALTTGVVNAAHYTAGIGNTEAYIGIASTTSVASSGTTTGFSYINSPTQSGNQSTYNLGIASATTFTPTAALTAGSYATGAIIVAVASAQSITFTAPATGAVNGSFALTAPTSTSTLPVTLSVDGSTTNSACTLSGNTVNYHGVGNCVIDADQAGNGDFAAAARVQRVIAVGSSAQTISFTAPSSGTVGQSAALAATATSGLAVAFTVDATSTNNACSIAGSTVTYQHAGSCVIDANQAGDQTYLVAAQVQHAVLVGKASQSITFAAPTSGGVNASVSLTGTAGSGLAVTWTVDPSTTNGACSIAGPTVSYLHPGTCVIDANQAGNADYNAAAQVQQAVSVAKGGTSIHLKFSSPTMSYGHENADRITVTVAPQFPGTKPRGKVTISGAGKKLCELKLSAAGKASCSLRASELKIGSYRLSTSYAGSSDFTGRSSKTRLLVTEPATKTSLSVTTAKVTLGNEQVARVIVSVRPVFGGPAPAGRVIVTSPAHVVCVIALAKGNGDCALASKVLGKGTYHLGASYAGSASYGSSSSAKKTFTVK